MRTPHLAKLACPCSAWRSALLRKRKARKRSTRSLAATCANCHGTNGKVVQGSQVTSLAGLDKSYIVAQMNAFKTGARPATVMHQISKGFNDAQIESLAGYFAAQKK
jgi:sulfide dehydrogenase cytochrome subunit